MTANEAYKIVINEFKDKKVIKCVDYKSRFMFQVIPKESSAADAVMMFNISVFVDKETGKVGVFQPFMIPIEEFNDGKEIHDYL